MARWLWLIVPGLLICYRTAKRRIHSLYTGNERNSELVTLLDTEGEKEKDFCPEKRYRTLEGEKHSPYTLACLKRRINVLHALLTSKS